MTAHGNDNVILALEKMLAEARRGEVGYIITVMVAKDHPPMGFWGGSVSMETMAALEMRQLMGALDHEIINKVLPPRAIGIPADRVCYNIPLSPLSFDFSCWLIDAEMTRRIEGAPGPLKVCFWFGRDGKTGIDDPSRQQMLNCVMRPLLALIGAVEDDSAVDGRYKQFFSTRDIVNRSKAGFDVPKCQAPKDKRKIMAAQHQGAVTITLREAAVQPFRNSNIEAWFRFAQYLRSQGEKVVFVRDTARAHDPVDGFKTCPEASIDLHWRLALYEVAKTNLFVSNGPGGLSLFCNYPWLMFLKPEDQTYEYEPNTPNFWRDNIGVEMGSQFPWCRPDQRMVWMADDYENLVQAWRDSVFATRHDRVLSA